MENLNIRNWKTRAKKIGTNGIDSWKRTLLMKVCGVTDDDDCVNKRDRERWEGEGGR